ncbi:MAG: ATP-binding protein [Acetobacterium woodii]|nr:ATP-binding protein [Acetobacterium woodii]
MKKLTVNASTENLSKVLEFIDDELEVLDASMKIIFLIGLAVEEIYVNIVRYAYTPNGGKVTIELEHHDEPSQLEIRFIDQGNPFNSLDNAEPDITLSAEEREIGGLGILMIKKTMDTVNYAFENNENRLTIKKIIS